MCFNGYMPSGYFIYDSNIQGSYDQYLPLNVWEQLMCIINAINYIDISSVDSYDAGNNDFIVNAYPTAVNDTITDSYTTA